MADTIKLNDKQLTTLKGMNDALNIIQGRMQSYVNAVLDGAEGIKPEDKYELNLETGELIKQVGPEAVGEIVGG